MCDNSAFNRSRMISIFQTAGWIFMACLIPFTAWSNQPIDVHSGAMVDTNLELYGPDSPDTAITENDDSYQYLSFIDFNVEAGKKYFARVTVASKSTTHNTGEYTIQVNGPGGEVNGPDPEMTPIIINADPIIGRFDSPDEEHWYVFQPSNDGNCTVVLNAPEGHMLPMKWKKFPVNYTIDRGPLGPMDSEKAIEFTKGNIETWNNIDSTSFRLEFGGTLDMDVQYSLFETFPAMEAFGPVFYDPAREDILVFGDWETESPISSFIQMILWRWNSLAWQKENTDRTPKGSTETCVYDTARVQTVLFGGEETWIWENDAWTLKTTTVSPSTRSGHAMAYDEERQQAVLFGGMSSSGEYFNDTWTWNGGNWTLAAQGAGPSARSHHSLFYDPVRKTVLLFGGKSTSALYNDLWEWNGNEWSEVSTVNGPAAQHSALVCVLKNNQAVLVGGIQPPGQEKRTADTWTWDGASWNQAAPADPVLAEPDALVMAYHKKHDQLILLSGTTASATSAEIYVWDGIQWNAWGQGPAAYSHFRDELQARGINPLFFDNDGRMTDMVQGQGAGDVVRGFGKPVYKDTETGEILGGHMFINGRLVDKDLTEKGYTGVDDDYKLSNLAQLIVHEFGHFCGLFHSQAYGYAHANSYLADESFLPIMWGIRPRPESSVTLSGLKPDDIATLSDLYPDEAGVFAKSTGVIKGQAVFEDGSPVLTGIVLARSIDDRYDSIVTTDTDPLVGFGGYFTLPPVAPGQYEVWIEPMIYSVDGTWFHQTGFHALYPQDRAFTHPPRPQYYQSSGSTPYGPSVLQLVTVTAGQDTEINFICGLLEPANDPVDWKLRASQFMAFNSLMISGHGDLLDDNRLAPMPFSYEITDGIDDVAIAVIPHDGQPLGIEIDFGMNSFYSSNNSPGLMQSGENGTFTVSFTRNGENGYPLENGVYFIDVIRLSNDAAAYTLQLNSESIDQSTRIGNWEIQ